MQRKLFPAWIINLFFIIGLVSAFLFRIIIVLKYFDPIYSRISWYIAVIGYIFFFGYRFYISYKRRLTISENDLTNKISSSNLKVEDRNNINYILNSLLRSREMFNYIFIFILSGIAIAADILLFFLIGK